MKKNIVWWYRLAGVRGKLDTSSRRVQEGFSERPCVGGMGMVSDQQKMCGEVLEVGRAISAAALRWVWIWASTERKCGVKIRSQGKTEWDKTERQARPVRQGIREQWLSMFGCLIARWILITSIDTGSNKVVVQCKSSGTSLGDGSL